MNETQNPALNNSIDQMSGADEQLWMAAGRAELSFRCDTSAPNVEHGPGEQKNQYLFGRQSSGLRRDRPCIITAEASY
jgi:hypothetical protein